MHTRVEDPPTSDPVPLSTSVSTTLLLQRLKHFRFEDSTLVATEVLLNMNRDRDSSSSSRARALSDLLIPDYAPLESERGLYRMIMRT